MKKTIKAWAVIAKSDGWLFQVHPLAEKRPTMLQVGLPKHSFRVVPITIIYEIPRPTLPTKQVKK